MNKDTMMLAKLTIGRWTGRKYDREVSTKLNDSEAANHDASRVNKLLVPKHLSAWHLAVRHDSLSSRARPYG